MAKTLSLRAARKLENKITKYMAANPVTKTFTYNVFDGREPLNLLQEEKLAAAKNLALHEDLLQLRSEIRRLIQKENSSALDDKIALRKLYLDMISFWKGLIAKKSDYDDVVTDTIFMGQVEAMKKNDPTASYRHTVSVTTIDSVLLKDINTKIHMANKKVEALDEELLSLNAKVTIILSNDQEELLNTIDLI